MPGGGPEFTKPNPKPNLIGVGLVEVPNPDWCCPTFLFVDADNFDTGIWFDCSVPLHAAKNEF